MCALLRIIHQAECQWDTFFHVPFDRQPTMCPKKLSLLAQVLLPVAASLRPAPLWSKPLIVFERKLTFIADMMACELAVFAAAID